jgi:hypothetical protein
MPPVTCILYRDFPGDGLTRIRQTLNTSLDRRSSTEPLPVLFRADDVGVPSANFLRLLDLFSGHALPLSLAVVPSWLTAARWSVFKSQVHTGSSQWCWHQHGWRHANHQPRGKKAEFGGARTKSALRADLSRGKDRLEEIMGADFSPIFTPPWNRCSEQTLELLAELDYQGVSRSRGEQAGRAPLPDLYINVDAHTRKEADSDAALQAMCLELSQAVEDRYISIMIHHQLMNDTAFELLELLLSIVSRSSTCTGCSFTDLKDSGFL